MRHEDKKRVNKAQQRAKKDRIQEEKLRQKYEQQTPLILDMYSSDKGDTSETAP